MHTEMLNLMPGKQKLCRLLLIRNDYLNPHMMKRNPLKLNYLLVILLVLAGSIGSVFSQLPATLEKELLQFNSAVYDALKIIQTNNEADAVTKLSSVKPRLRQQASSLAAKLSQIPDLSEAEEEEWVLSMSEKPEIRNLMTLLSDPGFMQKIENSQVLQQEFEELMSLLDLEPDPEEYQPELSGSQVCSFVVGSGSPLSGSYLVNAQKEEAFAYMDTENDQFVIEIHGENYMDLMLIIEEPVVGRHIFTMEMQVAIDLSTNEGEDYFGFDNHQEEGGGYIQIDRLDKIGGTVSGSFQGSFNDSSTDGDNPVEVNGRFSVTRM